MNYMTAPKGSHNDQICVQKFYFFMTGFFWFHIDKQLRFKSISKTQIYLFVKKLITKKLKKYNAGPVTMRL